MQANCSPNVAKACPIVIKKLLVANNLTNFQQITGKILGIIRTKAR